MILHASIQRRLLLIPWILVIILPNSGHCLYFTQQKLELAHIRPVTQIHLRPILELDESGTVSYKVSQISSNDDCPSLQVVKGQGLQNNGIIYYKHEMSLDNDGFTPAPCTYLVTATLEQRATVGATINITLTHFQPFHQCSNTLRCWAGGGEYKLQVMENSDEVMGIGLGYACNDDPEIEVTYDLKFPSTEQHGVLFIGDGIEGESKKSIWIRAQLDREYRDNYSFNLSCTVRDLREGNNHADTILVLSGALSVLDMDDNGPLTQEGSNKENISISFKHEHNKYEPHHRLIQDHPASLFFRDADNNDTNNFELIVHNDLKGLLNVTFTTKGVPSETRPRGTVILPTINLSSNIHNIVPWAGLYCVDATFIDTSIIPAFRNQSTMEYVICIHWMMKNSSILREAVEAGDWRRGPNASRMEESETVPYSSVLSPSTLDGTVCNEVCLVIVSCIGMASTVLVVVVIVLLKSRVSHKKKGRGGGGHNLLSTGTGDVNGDHSGMSMMIIDSEMDYLSGNTPRRHPQQHETEFTIDSKWEIPRKALILENSIGAGQFGHVYKARTDGIRGREGTFVEVAVKMLKDNHNETGKSCRQEFLSEFSLLQQLDHPNVIKVLGVCTTNGGPLFLVMDYAEFGSLRGFLRKCRRVESMETGIEPEFSGSTLPTTPNPVEQQDYVVSPREILQFSWQIAKGMTYLSDMKMVHRDLAARNILLTRSKVCKISDFGLTRDIYVDDAYQKKSRGPVPVKWLAPESLADEVYTKKSDVWSYGILLWELATLGASPYPGIPAEELYTLLKGGYRMPPPPSTSTQFYAIMRECWAHEPWNRPTFRSIEISLGKLLEEGIEYLKLDLPLVSNPGYDYFSTTTEELHPFTYESQSSDLGIPTTGPHGVHSYMNSGQHILPPENYIIADSTAYETPIGGPSSPPPPPLNLTSRPTSTALVQN